MDMNIEHICMSQCFLLKSHITVTSTLSWVTLVTLVTASMVSWLSSSSLFPFSSIRHREEPDFFPMAYNYVDTLMTKGAEVRGQGWVCIPLLITDDQNLIEPLREHSRRIHVTLRSRINVHHGINVYIGHFGYYIKIYFLSNKNIWKIPTRLKISCTFIRDRRVMNNDCFACFNWNYYVYLNCCSEVVFYVWENLLLLFLPFMQKWTKER